MEVGKIRKQERYGCRKGTEAGKVGKQERYGSRKEKQERYGRGKDMEAGKMQRQERHGSTGKIWKQKGLNVGKVSKHEQNQGQCRSESKLKRCTKALGKSRE